MTCIPAETAVIGNTSERNGRYIKRPISCFVYRTAGIDEALRCIKYGRKSLMVGRKAHNQTNNKKSPCENYKC